MGKYSKKQVEILRLLAMRPRCARRLVSNTFPVRTTAIGECAPLDKR